MRHWRLVAIVFGHFINIWLLLLHCVQNCVENQLSDFDNCWYDYSGRNLPLNDCSVFHLTQCMLLHYLGKADQAKYEINRTPEKNISDIIDCNLNKD